MYQEYKDILRGQIYHFCTFIIVQNGTFNKREFFPWKKLNTYTKD